MSYGCSATHHHHRCLIDLQHRHSTCLIDFPGHAPPSHPLTYPASFLPTIPYVEAHAPTNDQSLLDISLPPLNGPAGCGGVAQTSLPRVVSMPAHAPALQALGAYWLSSFTYAPPRASLSSSTFPSRSPAAFSHVHSGPIDGLHSLHCTDLLFGPRAPHLNCGCNFLPRI